MFKQRILAGAMSLALLGSAAIGLTNHASAASGTVTVGGTVASYMSLSLDTSSVLFGDALTFTGQTGSNSNVHSVCTNPGGTPGARFVSQDITGTVVSSGSYDVTLGSGDSDSGTHFFSTFGDTFRIGQTAWSNDCSIDPATTIGVISSSPQMEGGSQWHFIQDHALTASSSFTQYYTLDVMLGGLPASTVLATQLVYTVTAS